MESDYESKFYSDILLKISQQPNHSESNIKWICYKIIELMGLLAQNADKNFVKNALILILTNFMDIECDNLMQMGRDLKECSAQAQREIYNILREEFQ